MLPVVETPETDGKPGADCCCFSFMCTPTIQFHKNRKQNEAAAAVQVSSSPPRVATFSLFRHTASVWMQNILVLGFCSKGTSNQLLTLRAKNQFSILDDTAAADYFDPLTAGSLHGFSSKLLTRVNLITLRLGHFIGFLHSAIIQTRMTGRRRGEDPHI